MEISQNDRNKLRESQSGKNSDPHQPVGNIIEHKTMNPRRYKDLSKSPESDNHPRVISCEIDYQPLYIPREGPTKRLPDGTILENLTLDLDDRHDNVWVDLDKLELDKLEWMSRTKDEALDSSLKFDRNGRVAKEDDESHDIATLINLLDSTYVPQINYSLNVIAKIADMATIGYFDGAFSENIHEILVNECLLRARRHMDSNNETTYKSALRCLRSIICNTHIDEILLDRAFTILSQELDPNLWLFDDQNPVKFPRDMEDKECVKLDTLRALLERTRILERYIFLLKQDLDRSYQEEILDTLIRLSRHSLGACIHMLNKKTLLPILLEKFLPVSIRMEDRATWSLALKSLKLIRIVAQARYEAIDDSHSNGSQSSIPLGVLKPLQSYFFIDCYDSSSGEDSELLFKLHIESLRTIKTLFQLKVFQKGIVEFLTLGRDKLYMSLRSLAALHPLKPIKSQVSSNWQYAAHLIDITGFFSKYEHQYMTVKLLSTEHTSIWTRIAKPIALHWMNIIVKEKYIPHVDVSIAIATAVYHLRNIPDTDTHRDLINTAMNPILDELNKSKDPMNYFKLLIRSAADCTQLQRFLKKSGNLRDPPGLPSYGCLNYNTTAEYKFSLHPLFEKESPFILLDMYIKHIMDKQVDSEHYEKFFNHEHTIRYISAAADYQNLPTTHEAKIQVSLLGQYEVRLISRLLLMFGSFYLNSHRRKIEFGEPGYEDCEKEEKETYSNLCYYTVAIIALLNATSNQISDLKDDIFDRVLMHYRLRDEMAKEDFLAGAENELRLLEQRDFTGETVIREYVDCSHTEVLSPLYTSTVQSNRYWLFQPIVDYYLFQIKAVAEGRAKRVKNWIKKVTPWKIMTGDLVSCDDARIMAMILEFNYMILICSPTYNQVFIRNDVEEYLCILGSLFLDDDLFHCQQLTHSLSKNIKIILMECLKKVDGSTKVPFQDASKVIANLNLPLADFFNKLLDQFESVSYGEVAFSNFLILFLHPQSDKVFKKLAFQDKAETLPKILSLSVGDIYVPTDLYFKVKETDPEVKTLLRRIEPRTVKRSFLSEYCCYQINAP